MLALFEKFENKKHFPSTHQSCHVPLELPVGGAPLEHDVDVAESGEGGLPGDVLRLLVQVGGRAQGQLVVQVTGSGQVQGVVDDLGADSKVL